MIETTGLAQHVIRKPYLVFTGSETEPTLLKSAIGVAEWARDDCVGQWKLVPEGLDIGLPKMSPHEARSAGAKALLIGVAPFGGKMDENWIGALVEALEADLDIVSGLHTRLADNRQLAKAAKAAGRTIHDIRHPAGPIPLAIGAPRLGNRVLTVGTDCALGKKYTALAITRELSRRGLNADFRATGQTGIMIAGSGIAIDGVVADFIAGAAEALSPAADANHWDVIEGQGAILHPAYAGVTLGLLHGSQPDALVLCHDPERTHLAGFPERAMPDPADVVPIYEHLARTTNPSAKVVAMSLNTSRMSVHEAHACAEQLEARHTLPCFDPLRFGIDVAVDAILGHVSNGAQAQK